MFSIYPSGYTTPQNVQWNVLPLARFYFVLVEHYTPIRSTPAVVIPAIVSDRGKLAVWLFGTLDDFDSKKPEHDFLRAWDPKEATVVCMLVVRDGDFCCGIFACLFCVEAFEA